MDHGKNKMDPKLTEISYTIAPIISEVKKKYFLVEILDKYPESRQAR